MPGGVSAPVRVLGVDPGLHITGYGVLELSGKRIAWVLGIPKDDNNTWHDTSVIIRGERYRTIGYPVFGTPENMPMWWKGYVKVERYDG